MLAAFVLALAAGAAGRKRLFSSDGAVESIVAADEDLRDAPASLPLVPPPAVVAPSRVAIWASPALRRNEAEKILLSSRRRRAGR